MFIRECNGQETRGDEAEFLVDQNEWDEDIAVAFAYKEGSDSLSARQMDIILFTREYFEKYNAFPVFNNVFRIAHQPKQRANEQCINMERTWKVAGVPKQDGAHFVTLDGKHYFRDPYC